MELTAIIPFFMTSLPRRAKGERGRAEGAHALRCLSTALVAWMVVLGILGGEVRSAEADPQRKEPAASEFRRIFVPVDQLKDLPRNQVRYVPMKPDEFERVLRSARAAGAGVPSVAARIASAQYHAKLSPDGVLRGEATLQIVHAAEGEVTLPLEPRGLAITEAEWAADEPQPVEFGLGTDGKLEALISRSGALRLGWSLRGSRDSYGSIQFAWELPACPSNTLFLDLPKDLKPAMTPGLVLRESPEDAVDVRWRLSLGGHTRLNLQIAPGHGPEERRPLTMVRQFLVYDLSLRGLELSAELRLDVHHEALRQITIALDPGLELVTAKYGESAMAWSILSRPTKDRGARVLLELPEPVQGIGRVVRLGAVSPLITERNWRLPGLRTEGTAWQEGNATLRIRSPLKLQQLAPVHGRQSKTAALSAPAPGESVEIQFFSEDAGTEVVVARQSPSVQTLSGTTVELRGGEVIGQVVAQFQVAEGEVFLLEAELGRQWLIDSVQPDPPDVLGDGWSVRRESDGSRRLVIRLGKALSPARPLRLIVTGRRLQSPLGRSISLADLIPLKFLHSASPRHLAALNTVEPYRVKIDTAHAQLSIDPASLTPVERSLFLVPPRELLFESNAETGNLRLSLETAKPSYSADIRVEAAVAGKTLAESYTFRIIPETRVDRLLVHFTQSRRHPPKWVFPNGGENQFAARHLSPTEQAAAGMDAEGESWEITVRHPKSSTLEIQAARTTDLESGQAISLASLPQADKQEGGLLVRSPEAIHIDNLRLESVPVPDAPAEQISTTRGVFRYRPDSDAVRSDDPAVTVSPGTEMLPQAWVWNCRIESRYQADGTGRHTAVYRIQSHGKRQFVVLLPPSTDPGKEISVWSGPQPSAWRHAESPRTGAIVVDLPAGMRFPVVTVQFVSKRNRDGLAGIIDPSLPAADVPVLSQDWIVWLPPGYAVADRQGAAPFDRNLRLTWSQRLFGPLGRPANQEAVRLGDSSRRSEQLSVATQSAPDRLSEPAAPWTLPSHIGDDPLDTLGWTVHPIRIPRGAPVRLLVVHEDSFQTLAWILFLATTALSWWIASRRPAAVAPLLAVAATVAMLVPEPYSPMASGAMLGVLASLGLLLVRTRAAREGRSQDATCGSSTMAGSAPALGGTAILALFAVGLAAPAASADESPAETAPRVVHNVLIPVDEQEKPTGGSYYVPEAFYQELRRRSATLSEEPQGWLLREATYRGTLARQAAAAQWVMTELKAVFDIEVFNRSVRVQIPLSREGANLQAESVTLDGRVIQPEWQDTEGTLMIEISEPGPYRLEVALRPATQSVGPHAGIDLRIPRLATSRLELNLPADAPAVEVLSAKGAVIRQQAPPRLLAELGSSDRLTLRWPRATGEAPVGPVTDAEMLLWLQIHPGSVVLNAKLKLKAPRGAVRQLQLLADPRLRLLPLQDSAGPVKRVQVTPGQPQEIQFEMSPPISDPTVVAASFLLTGTSGIGNLRLPYLEVKDLQVTKRWMAVSVDPALVYEQDAPGTLEAVALPEFTAAWGAADSQPALAYSLGPDQPDWTLATRPDEPHVAVDQVLALSLGPGTSRVRLEAQLVTTGYSFQYRFSVPKDLEIEEISVRELSIERTARWSRDAQGGVTVFLNGPASERQHLSLHGKLPTPTRGTMPLPQIRVQGTEMRSCEIQLFRESSVLVNVAKTEGLDEVEPPIVNQDKAPFGRLVKWFSVADCSRPIRAEFTISPNRPEVAADQMIYVYNASGTWEADVEYRVAVRRGVVDEFRLRVPPQWNGPYRTTAAATLHQLDASDGRSELVIRPQQAIEGQYRFRVSGPLEFSAGQRVAAPDIRLLDAKRGRSLIILPTRVESGEANWETRELSETDLPDDLAVPPAAREWLVAYEMKNDGFQAVLNPAAASSRSPAILLSDVRLVWYADGHYQQWTAFDVDPAGTKECLLSLPAGAELVDLRVAGVPSVLRSKGEGVWGVAFATPAPQRVELLLIGRLSEPSADGSRQFDSPRLGELPVARTLWSISGPAEFLPRPPAGIESVDALDLEMVRLKSTVSCADLALMDRGKARQTAAGWSEAWFRSWRTGRERLKQRLAHAGGSNHVERIAAELEMMAGKMVEFARRLNTPPQLPADTENVMGESSQRWQETVPASANTVHYVSTPGSTGLKIAYSQAPAEPWWERLLVALGCVVLVPLVWFGRLRKTATQLAYRWPAALGVCAGLVWWLWLEPSVLGWVIVAGTLLLAIFPLRRRPSHVAVIVVPLSQNPP